MRKTGGGVSGCWVFPQNVYRIGPPGLRGAFSVYESGKKAENVWNYGVFAGLLLIEISRNGFISDFDGEFLDFDGELLNR